MVSEPVAAEAARLAALAAAAFFGLGAAAAIRSIIRRGDGGGRRRSIAAMLAASGAVAAGAWAFVALARLGAVPAMTAVYAALGFAAGLLGGLFPRAAGVPLVLAAILASGLAAAGLGTWLAWNGGTEAARLTVYSATGQGSLQSLRSAAGRGRSEERNLELADGPVTLEFEVVTIAGPFSVAFGTRRYRLVAVVAGGTRVVLPGDRGPLLDQSGGGLMARLLGCSVEKLLTPPFEPSTLATASYVLLPDGSIELSTR